MPINQDSTEVKQAIEDSKQGRAKGTMVLVLILLFSFVVYYFANWKALADLWWVR